MEQVHSGTGIHAQRDWYIMELVHNGTRTQWNWYTTGLVHNETDTQLDWYTMELVHIGTGTQRDRKKGTGRQWDRNTTRPGLVHNRSGTGTQRDRGLVHNGSRTGTQGDRGGEKDWLTMGPGR